MRKILPSSLLTFILIPFSPVLVAEGCTLSNKNPSLEIYSSGLNNISTFFKERNLKRILEPQYKFENGVSLEDFTFKNKNNAIEAVKNIQGNPLSRVTDLTGINPNKIKNPSRLGLAIVRLPYINEYGVFATKCIKKDTIVGFYVGEVKLKLLLDENMASAYLVDFAPYPPKLKKKPPYGEVVIDGTSYRNMISYINETSKISNKELINVIGRYAVIKTDDKSPKYRIVIAYITVRTIQAGEQLITFHGTNHLKNLGVDEVDLHAKDIACNMKKRVLTKRTV